MGPLSQPSPAALPPQSWDSGCFPLQGPLEGPEDPASPPTPAGFVELSRIINTVTDLPPRPCKPRARGITSTHQPPPGSPGRGQVPLCPSPLGDKLRAGLDCGGPRCLGAPEPGCAADPGSGPGAGALRGRAQHAVRLPGTARPQTKAAPTLAGPRHASTHRAAAGSQDAGTRRSAV